MGTVSNDGTTLIAGAQFGRENELWRLTELYQNPTESNPLVIINGMNGIGKSELSNTFGKLMTDMKICGPTLRLNGASDIRLYENLRQIAPMVGIPIVAPKRLPGEIVQVKVGSGIPVASSNSSQGSYPRDSIEILNDCVSIMSIGLKPPKKIILILDNVDDLEADVSSVLTSDIVQAKCFIVVNSTNAFLSLRYPESEVISLKILELEHSKQFVLKEIENELESDVENLCNLMQNFPLALKLAVSCIKSVGTDEPYKIKDYLRDFQIQKQNEDYSILNEMEHEYKEVIFTVLNLSLEKIKAKDRNKGQGVTELLDLAAYFEPEQMFIDFLWKIQKQVSSSQPFMEKKEFESLVFELYDYTLLKGTGTACQLHRVVGQVTRVKLRSREREIEVLKKIVKAVDSMYEELEGKDMIHVMCLWKYASNYDEIVKEFDSFCDRFADKLQGLGLTKEKESFVRGCLEGVRRALGDEHLQTMTMECQLAEALRLTGKNEESLEKFKECIRKQKGILGEENSLYLITNHNMALVLEAQGKRTEAIETFKTLLELNKKVFGLDHKKTMTTTRNLVTFLTKQGNHNEAIGILEGILEDRKSRLGEHDAATLTTMEMKGECLWESGATDLPNNLGNFRKAKELFERVVELKEEHLGAFSKETCESKYNLALRLCGFNESGKSLELLDQVLKARVQVLGDRHPLTMETRSAISRVMWASGRTQQ